MQLVTPVVVATEEDMEEHHQQVQVALAAEEILDIHMLGEAVLEVEV